MSPYNFLNDGDQFGLQQPQSFDFDIDSIYPETADPADIFSDLTKELQKKYEINKGVLVIREQTGTRYIAVAAFSAGKEFRQLSLKLPSSSSLFEIAAEDGSIYTENYFGLFSGNSFEKNLLLSKGTESFLLHPVKCDGQVVALIGYSSEVTDAFVTFDDGLLAKVCDQFGRRIVSSTHLHH